MSKKIFENILIDATGTTLDPHFSVIEGSNGLEVLVESDGQTNISFIGGTGSQESFFREKCDGRRNK